MATVSSHAHGSELRTRSGNEYTPENGEIKIAMLVEHKNLVFKIENSGELYPEMHYCG